MADDGVDSDSKAPQPEAVDSEQVTDEQQIDVEQEQAEHHNSELDHEGELTDAGVVDVGPVSDVNSELAIETGREHVEADSIADTGQIDPVVEDDTGVIHAASEGEHEVEQEQSLTEGETLSHEQQQEDSAADEHVLDDLENTTGKMETFAESEEVESALAATSADDESPLGDHDAAHSADEDALHRVDEEEDDNETSAHSGFTKSGSFLHTDDPKSVAEMVSEAERFDSVINADEDTADMEHSDKELEEEQDENQEEQRIEVKSNREQLLEKYHQALSARHQIQEHNYQLQHRLVEMFRQRRSDDVKIGERSSSEQEKRYLNYMASLDGLHRQAVTDSQLMREQVDELVTLCADKDEEVNAERLGLIEYKKHIAVSAVSSRTGRLLHAQDIEPYLTADEKKEAEVIAVRLENIKLKNKLKKQEAQLKSKEELAEGLHLIDFEQLKIENQTYNEKIEERNEELQKLRRKITSTVQVLTHLKEKLQFVYGENQVEKERLREIEELVARKRDGLSRTKQVRDGLRIDNHRLNQNSGLLGNTLLLRDFESQHDDTDYLQQHLAQLKMMHAELTLNLDGVRRKIDASKVA
jgi:hypothetical protein